MISQLKSDLKKLADPQRAKNYSRFFKTGKGQYGEGDKFLGINVPQQRQLSRKYKNLPLNDLQKLLDDPFHECRILSLMILVNKYKKSKDDQEKKEITDLYLKNAAKINNWDMVDISAPHIPGDYFLDKNKSILYSLAKSKNLWQRRIAVLSTFGFIRENHFQDSLKIAEILLHDPHDLIHKAVGWMLREIGKRDRGIEEKFLKKYYQVMPRTMLRYAIEKFDEKTRDFYLGRLLITK